MAQSRNTGRPQPAPPPPPQDHDVPVRAVGITLIAFPLTVAAAAVLVIGLIWLLPQAPSQPPVSALERQPQVPPPPRLQVDPSRDLAQLQARNAARLEGYGWIDRAKGIVHIPIERAMQMLATQGWPDPPPDNATPGATP
jgi:hypothetical protein